VSVRLILTAGVGALAITFGGLAVAGQSRSQTPGAPLTKEEYQQQAFHFGDEVVKTNRLYYDLALEPFPRKKCGAGVRKYHRMLSAILGEASPLVPPPEIADIHARLMAGAGRIVRGVAHIAKRAQRGRLVCGYDIEHPAPNEVGNKINRAYFRSGFDPALNQLYGLGYVLGGE
jgi:hypothetical protein